jgi:hypothetical protein
MDPDVRTTDHCIFNSVVVADPRNVDAPPALTFLCVAESDPTFHFDANPDPAFLCGSCFNVVSDPDPASQNTIFAHGELCPGWTRRRPACCCWPRVRRAASASRNSSRNDALRNSTTPSPTGCRVPRRGSLIFPSPWAGWGIASARPSVPTTMPAKAGRWCHVYVILVKLKNIVLDPYPDPDWIRIQWGPWIRTVSGFGFVIRIWIRIQEGKKDAQK